MKNKVGDEYWALILGASSGFGEAACLEFARAGYHIAGVHMDRRGTMPHVNQLIKKIEETGQQALFFNGNAADEEQRMWALDDLKERIWGVGRVKVMMHSLAFGALRPFIADRLSGHISAAQMNMTLDVMAHSLVYWTQGLIRRKIMIAGGRIYAMTSSGGARVLPSYGAVSAAKAALESHVRQLALELAPYGITINTIRAGVTDTPALRKIPGKDVLIDTALARNPHDRLTTPEDVARAMVTFAADETAWMTGNVIGVDGGEDIVG